MRAPVRGIEIDYQLTGDGRTLVWGHGLTSSRADEEAEPVLLDWGLVGEATGLLRYDARGHGGSGHTTDPTGYGWDQLALDQLELVDTLGVDRFVVGGASMGAATALHTAVTAPDRIDGLVLAIPPTAWETRAAQTDNYRAMADIVETRGVELLIAAGAQLPPPDPYSDDDDYHDRRAARMRSADPGRLADVFRGAATADLPPRDAIRAVTVPTLILAWTGDVAHPVTTAEALDELLPNARLHLASTAAELATWTDRLITFLGQLPTRS